MKGRPNSSGKWCLAELATARLGGINTVMVKLPDFFLPSEENIQLLEQAVPDIGDLQVCGIGMADVSDTLRWLNGLSTLSLGQPLLSSELKQVVNCLTLKTGSSIEPTHAVTESDCMLLANQVHTDKLHTDHIRC